MWGRVGKGPYVIEEGKQMGSMCVCPRKLVRSGLT